MPSGKKPEVYKARRSRKRDHSQHDVDPAVGLEQNQNSNHARSTTNTRNRLRSVVHDVSKPSTRKKNKVREQNQSSDELLNEEEANLSENKFTDEDEGSSQYDEGQNDNLNKAKFIEEEEIIHMEIDDGGRAAEEFSSDYENNSDSDSIADQGVDDQSDGQAAAEDSDTENSQDQRDEMRSKRKNVKDREQRKRLSIEDKLDGLSNTLEVMKDIFVKSGFMQAATKKAKASTATPVATEPQPGPSKQPGKGLNLSSSETTIYHNALNKTKESRVDPEITFQFIDHNSKHVDSLAHVGDSGKLVDQNCSSLSDDRIDTSDELMEVDTADLDFNERFIADCTAEAQRKKSQAANDDTMKKLARDKADHMTREVEAH